MFGEPDLVPLVCNLPEFDAGDVFRRSILLKVKKMGLLRVGTGTLSERVPRGLFQSITESKASWKT